MTLLKKILSYFVDIQLDTAHTQLNPRLELSLRKGRLYLTTQNAVYSHGDLYLNFRRTFKRIDFHQNKFNDILVLGFGMGSVPFMLEKVFNQKFHCTGVEADGKIVEWARRWALPKLTNTIQLLHQDAFDFVEKCSQRFDLVVVDVFLDDIVPSQFESLDFLQKTKSLLNPNGLLLFNRMADLEGPLAATKAFFERDFKTVFPEADYLEITGNWVLANRKAWK